MLISMSSTSDGKLGNRAVLANQPPKPRRAAWSTKMYEKYFRNSLKITLNEEMKQIKLIDIMLALNTSLPSAFYDEIEYLDKFNTELTWFATFSQKVDASKLYNKEIVIRNKKIQLENPCKKINLQTYKIRMLPHGCEDQIIERFFHDRDKRIKILKITRERHKELNLEKININIKIPPNLKSGNVIVKVDLSELSEEEINSKLNTGITCHEGMFVQLIRFGEKPKCLICDSTEHFKANCPLLKTKCEKCNRVGHLSGKCLIASLSNIEAKLNFPAEDEELNGGVNMSKYSVDKEQTSLRESKGIERQINELAGEVANEANFGSAEVTKADSIGAEPNDTEKELACEESKVAGQNGGEKDGIQSEPLVSRANGGADGGDNGEKEPEAAEKPDDAAAVATLSNNDDLKLISKTYLEELAQMEVDTLELGRNKRIHADISSMSNSPIDDQQANKLTRHASQVNIEEKPQFVSLIPVRSQSKLNLYVPNIPKPIVMSAQATPSISRVNSCATLNNVIAEQLKNNQENREEKKEEKSNVNNKSNKSKSQNKKGKKKSVTKDGDT